MKVNILPSDIEAERAVLSAILQRPHNLDEVATTLKSTDFYVLNHREIYLAVLELDQQGMPIDLVTIANYFKENGKDIPPSYVIDLYDGFISDANIHWHVKILKTKSHLRKLIQTADSISAQCYEQNEEEITHILSSAEIMISEALQTRDEREAVTISSTIFETLMEFDKDRPYNPAGIRSGFIDLDHITHGFQPGNLIILAARPGVGKTAFATNIIEFCGRNDVPVAIFSLEMSTREILFRMFSFLSKIPSQRIRTHTLEDKDYPKLVEAAHRLSTWKIFVDEVSGQTLTELRARTKLFKRKHGVRFIVIDYLQLMTSGERAENRNNEIAQITRALKLLARELEIPILLLSQLNRQVENRGDKRPTLADLRDSGQIEADADMVMFLYREHLYAPTAENERTAELIIGKHRNGPLATINLTWNAEITQFTNGMPRSLNGQQAWLGDD